MRIYDPVKVYFEKDCLIKYGNEIPGERILILTGRHSSKANGSLDELKGVLSGRELFVLDEVGANPTLSFVCDAADRFRDKGIDCVIGLGGGSAIDAAKAVAVLLANDKDSDIEKLFYADRNAAHLPIVAIPTTCGSGSEVTPFSVITDERVGMKRTIFTQLFACLAFADYKYLKTMPYKECVSTCFDAMAHNIESYLSANANTFNRFNSVKGLHLFRDIKDCLLSKDAYAKAKDIEFEKMMGAALMGGYAITVNTTTIPHGLANRVPHELNIPHGLAVLMFIPGFMRQYNDQNAVSKLLEYMGFDSMDSFEEYILKVTGPLEIPKTLWEDISTKMLSDTHKLKSYPYVLTKEKLDAYPCKLMKLV